jgi:hypothetical protein
MKTKSRKLLSTLLALVMVFGLFAAMPRTASAETGTIDIGGDTALNLNVNRGGTGWFWSAGSNVLNLDSAYTGEYILINCLIIDTINIVYSGNVRVSGIRCEGNMSIGRNTSDGKLRIENSPGYDEIYVHGNLTISGVADVLINATHRGIYSLGNITISGGTVTINSNDDGIRAFNYVTISGGTVTINSNDDGIYAGYIIISGGIVTINSTKRGIESGGSIRISGGTVNIISGTHGLLVLSGYFATISGGTVNIDSRDYGIAGGNVTISGGSGTIKGGSTHQAVRAGRDGLTVDEDIQVNGWSGSAYTVSSVIAADTSGLMSFYDAADQTTLLTNIQFGPAVSTAPVITSANSFSCASGTGGSFALTATGTAPITYSLNNAPAGVTVNGSTLNVAASIATGVYTFTVTASNGTAPNATQSFTLTVTSAVSITGPTAMTLTEDYEATSTGIYTITGNPAPTVTITSGNASITWDNANKRLNIAAGLAEGTYPVVLKASNGVNPDATLTFTLTVTPSGGIPFPFTDVPASEWYYDDVKTAWEQDLINGKSDTLFAPEDNLTYAEAVKLAACMNQLYSLGEVTLTNGSPNWYDSYVAYAKDKWIIFQDYDWNAPATRAEFMEIFARAVPLDEINTIADGAIPDVPMTHPRSDAIYWLYRCGIVKGVDAEHNCNPDANIKRSEVATILTRMMNEGVRISFSM